MRLSSLRCIAMHKFNVFTECFARSSLRNHESATQSNKYLLIFLISLCSPSSVVRDEKHCKNFTFRLTVAILTRYNTDEVNVECSTGVTARVYIEWGEIVYENEEKFVSLHNIVACDCVSECFRWYERRLRGDGTDRRSFYISVTQRMRIEISGWIWKTIEKK